MSQPLTKYTNASKDGAIITILVYKTPLSWTALGLHYNVTESYRVDYNIVLFIKPPYHVTWKQFDR